jgi:hypothetical protein
MMFISTSLVALLSLPVFTVGKVKRATPEIFSLYGYALGSGGLPLFYADGK